MAFIAGTVSVTAASATSVSVSSTAASGGSGTYTYQWLRSTDGGSVYTTIGGATSLTYTDSSVTSGQMYYYIIQATDTGVSPNLVTVSNYANALAFNVEAAYLQDDSGPSHAVAITLSGSDVSYNPVIRGIYVGTTGNVKVDTVGGETGVVYPNVNAGGYISGHFTKVYATANGTTASNLLAVW